MPKHSVQTKEALLGRRLKLLRDSDTSWDAFRAQEIRGYLDASPKIAHLEIAVLRTTFHSGRNVPGERSLPV